MKFYVHYISLLLLFCSLNLSGKSQDITGVWRGNFGSGDKKMVTIPGYHDRYKFEVQLDQSSKKISGVTYSYKTTVFYGKASCEGTFNPSTKKVLLDEVKLLEVRMTSGTGACLMTCFLQYSKMGDEEFLEGTYFSVSMTDSSNCGSGWVLLRKVPTSDFYKEPFIIKKENEEAEKKKQGTALKTNPRTTPKTNIPAKPTVKKPGPIVQNKKPPQPKPPVITKTIPSDKTDPTSEKVKPAPIDTVKKEEKKIFMPVKLPKAFLARENELVKTIATGAGTVTINIYDNGTIDNDTISVYLNKNLVINKQRLTDKAISFTFELNDENDEHEIVMVAENLGEIPPNTSLMVVKTGGKQYEVRITSTEQKNAVVRFKFERE